MQVKQTTVNTTHFSPEEFQTLFNSLQMALSSILRPITLAEAQRLPKQLVVIYDFHSHAEYMIERIICSFKLLPEFAALSQDLQISLLNVSFS